MADNITLNPGSGGAPCATDDVGGIQHQRVKVEYGEDGFATDVSLTNPLPVLNQAGDNAIGRVKLTDGTDVALVSAGGALLTDASATTQPVSLSATSNAGAAVKTSNYDTGVGTDTVTMVGVALPASGGAVQGGTATNPIRTDTTGTTTQPISAASLPLPSGASTESTLSALNTKAPAQGQALMAASVPVVVASNQSAIPVSGTVTANAGTGPWPITDNAGSITVDNAGTFATQAAQSGTWTVQPGNTANTTAWKVDGSAVTQPVSGTFWQATQPVSGTFWQATQPVSGTFWQATQPVSAASLPLPAGASTEATLATRLSESDFDSKTGILTETAPATDTASSGLNGRLQRVAQRLTSLIALLPAALVGGRLDTNAGAWLGSTAPTVGQKTMASSLPVVLASNQSTPLPAMAEIRAATLHVTATAAVNTGATCTLPAAGAGLFHYITSIELIKLYSVVGVASAAGVVITSTNLPGNPSWLTEQAAGAAGTAPRVIGYSPTTPLKSSAANVATTFVAGAKLQTIWRWNVSYFTAP